MGNFFLYPAPKPSYTCLNDDPTLILVPHKSDDNLSNFNTSFIYGTDFEKIPAKIPCRYIPCQHYVSQYLIVFFHGNAEDIGANLNFVLSSFEERFMMSVMCPEYPTYGAYKKKDESLKMDEAIIKDAKSVLLYCHEKLRFKYENIILVGRSLGTSVAVQLAAEFPVRGILLISPFTTIRGVARHLVGKVLAKAVPDVFRSIDYIDKVKCPTLLIHGKKDALIPYQMAIDLHNKATSVKHLKIQEDMTHNNFHLEDDVFAPFEEFMIRHLNLKAHLLGTTEDNFIMFEKMNFNFDISDMQRKVEHDKEDVNYEVKDGQNDEAETAVSVKGV